MANARVHQIVAALGSNDLSQAQELIENELNDRADGVIDDVKSHILSAMVAPQTHECDDEAFDDEDEEE
jgi:hypothetical protein